jgi:hypothetical protein
LSKDIFGDLRAIMAQWSVAVGVLPSKRLDLLEQAYCLVISEVSRERRNQYYQYIRDIEFRTPWDYEEFYAAYKKLSKEKTESSPLWAASKIIYSSGSQPFSSYFEVRSRENWNEKDTPESIAASKEFAKTRVESWQNIYMLFPVKIIRPHYFDDPKVNMDRYIIPDHIQLSVIKAEYKKAYYNLLLFLNSINMIILNNVREIKKIISDCEFYSSWDGWIETAGMTLDITWTCNDNVIEDYHNGWMDYEGPYNMEQLVGKPTGHTMTSSALTRAHNVRHLEECLRQFKLRLDSLKRVNTSANIYESTIDMMQLAKYDSSIEKKIGVRLLEYVNNNCIMKR